MPTAGDSSSAYLLGELSSSQSQKRSSKWGAAREVVPEASVVKEMVSYTAYSQSYTLASLSFSYSAVCYLFGCLRVYFVVIQGLGGNLLF